MSPIISRPHACRVPQVRVALGIYPLGTIWQCTRCGARWRASAPVPYGGIMWSLVGR